MTVSVLPSPAELRRLAQAHAYGELTQRALAKRLRRVARILDELIELGEGAAAAAIRGVADALQVYAGPAAGRLVERALARVVR